MISIAITLLVLDVRQAVHLLGPRLMGFGLSFAIVGVRWVGHHLMVRSMAVVPRSVLWANNLFLIGVTLLPATAALLGSYPHERASRCCTART